MNRNKVPQAKLPPSMDQRKLLECPICLDIIVPPITQCDVGHLMCKNCFDQTARSNCPLCMQPVTNKKQVALEQLIESVRDTLKTSCCYAPKGCKYNVNSSDKETHERDCKFRTFKCEGHIFDVWKCSWIGDYERLEDHFKRDHKNHTWMQYKTEVHLKVNFQITFKDIQLISFFNGQAYFYYKHYVDVQKEKLYWAFQYVGLKSNAEHFFYEFEVIGGPIRKFKVSEICHNDTTKIEDIFDLEKCVVMSFTSARNFLNDKGELHLKFRILKNKANQH